MEKISENVLKWQKIFPDGVELKIIVFFSAPENLKKVA
jgi:hypothetical protein